MKVASTVWFLLKWYITIMLFVAFPIPTIIATIICICIAVAKKQKPEETSALARKAELCRGRLD